MPDAADPLELLTIAVEIAEEAGLVLSSGARTTQVEVDTKTTGTDMVSEVDRESERLIAARLAERRPGDALLAEEGSSREGTTGVRWVVDPLDGTTNYLYRFPSYAVSIAAEVDGRTVAGAVHDPVHSETFSAARGAGSWCNGRRLRVHGAPTLATAMVATGFGYEAEKRGRQAAVLPRLLPAVRDLRRAGAASLDLCWVALGRVDAYYEHGLQPWDWAAGTLVASEAGARVEQRPDGTMFAAPPHLFEALVALVEVG